MNSNDDDHYRGGADGAGRPTDGLHAAAPEGHVPDRPSTSPREVRAVGGRCRSCDAPVLWLGHVRTGRAAPIDLGPGPNGNIEIDTQAGTYAIVPTPGPGLRTNHFATCPNAGRHHKGRP